MTPTPTVERGPNEVVERVAGAIQARLDSMPHKGDIDAGQFFREMARAAIEAMREPTADMIAAAFPCERDEEFSHTDKTLGAAACLKLGGWDKIGIMNGEPIKQAAFLARDYRLMIDAALGRGGV